MSAFGLKIIAIITMIIDHLGYAIFGEFSFFNYIGRIAFPIFAFQISEGYIHTKDLKKYFLRLFLFAIISQIPFMLFHSIISDQFYLNIFFTLLLGLLSIYIYDKCKYKILGIFLAFIFASIAQITKCDYGFFGVSIILIFYIFKSDIIKADIFFIIATLLKYIIPCIKYNVFPHEYLYLFLGTSFPAIFLTLYNGKKGKNTKYLLYMFYPIHLILLYGIYLILK